MNQVTVGTELSVLEQPSNLVTSVMYAGASGDHNPLHYDPEFAAQVSPTGGVIAHGMFSMGLVSKLVAGFAGGPERVRELAVRFTKPWPLGTTATFGGTVTAVDDDEVTIEVWGRSQDGKPILKGTARLAR